MPGLFSEIYSFKGLEITLGSNSQSFINSFFSLLLYDNWVEDFSYNSFSDAKLDPYQKNYWSKPENIDLYLVAKSKLLDFKNKNKPLHEILDVKKWANYFAICDLLYTHHGYAPKSVKFS